MEEGSFSPRPQSIVDVDDGPSDAVGGITYCSVICVSLTISDVEYVFMSLWPSVRLHGKSSVWIFRQ